MIEQYEAARAQPTSPDGMKLQSPRPYALKLAHKHIPEMMAHTGLTTKPVVHAHRRQLLQGTVGRPSRYTAPNSPAATLMPCTPHSPSTTRASASCACCRCSDPATQMRGAWDVQACNDTNRVDLSVFPDDTGEQAILMARLDNLGKGASGAAVQCMNLHLGVDEGLGL